jgi:hypothetical protein
MPTSSIHSFDRLILRFLKERQFHLEAVEEIDAIFKKHGISTMAHREGNGLLGTTTMRVAAAGTQKSTKTTDRKRGRRTTYKETSSEFITNLLKGKSLTTAEINAAWKKERKGTADNNLTAMFKAKQIKRTANKDGRGSSYSIA